MKNAMAKHRVQEHPDHDDLQIETKIVKSGIRHNISRYIGEALLIESTNNDPNIKVLNSRSEWGHNPLSRLRVDR